MVCVRAHTCTHLCVYTLVGGRSQCLPYLLSTFIFPLFRHSLSLGSLVRPGWMATEHQESRLLSSAGISGVCPGASPFT